MNRRISASSLATHLGNWRDGARAGPTYRRLADCLRLLIQDGRLPVGVRLPGERDLAAGLGVSRTTTAAALAALRSDGFVESRPGAGARTRIPPNSRVNVANMDGKDGVGLVDLASASLPAGADIHQAYVAALDRLAAYLPTTGYDPLGLEELRASIADRYSRRGLPTTPEQIMVTSGAVHGLALLLRAFTGPGDRVLIDHPTYFNAIDAIKQASCRPLPVSLPAQGWDEEGIIAAFRQGNPKLAYLIPDFHNPTGRCMSPRTRSRLAKAATEARVTLIFDEALVDLALDGELPQLDGAAEAGVVRLGSVGKSFWGGLRIGWVRAEEELLSTLASVRSSIDLGTPVLEQLAAATLLQSDAALSERRATLREQRDFLLEQIALRLPDWRVEVPAGGLSIWAELPLAISTALAATAELHGVRVTAGPRFGVDGAFERYMRFPFTQPIPSIERGIASLAYAYNAVAPVLGAGRRPDRSAGLS